MSVFSLLLYHSSLCAVGFFPPRCVLCHECGASTTRETEREEEKERSVVGKRREEEEEEEELRQPGCREGSLLFSFFRVCV